MATNLSVVMRDSSANGLDDIGRLLTKLGLTGTPNTIFAATVATADDERAEALMASLKNDPRVGAIGYQ